MKQLMAGAGVAVVGMVLVPLLSSLFTVLSLPSLSCHKKSLPPLPPKRGRLKGG